MTWHVAVFLAAFGVLLAACTACHTHRLHRRRGKRGAHAVAHPIDQSVKYGLPVSTPTLDTVGVWFGIDKGFFAEQGLDVQPTGYGRATSIRAMLSGDADIIEIDSGSALLAYNSGAPLTFINMPIPGALDVIVANPYDHLGRSAAGKNWATSGPGSQGEVFAEVLLQRHGIDLELGDLRAGRQLRRTAASALLAGTVDITTMTIATSPRSWTR